MLITDLIEQFDAITASGERAGPATRSLLNEELRKADDTLRLHGDFEMPGQGGRTAGVQIDLLLWDTACALVLSDDGYGADRGVVFAYLQSMEQALAELRPLFEPEPDLADVADDRCTYCGVVVDRSTTEGEAEGQRHDNRLCPPKGARPVVVVAGATHAAKAPKGVDVVHLHPGHHLAMAVHQWHFENLVRADVVEKIKGLASDGDLNNMPAIIEQLRGGSYPTRVALLTGERRVLARLLENDMELPEGAPAKTFPEEGDVIGLDAQELLDKLLWEPAGVRIPGTDRPINFNVDTGEIDYL